MKKYIQIILLSLATILHSCVDLEEEPVNQLRTNYFTDLISLRTAVNGTYRVLISDVWERSLQVGSFRVPLMGGDDLTTVTGANKEDWRQFDQFYQSSGNTRLQRSTWALLYDAIREANWDIEGAKALEGDFPQEEIDAIVAESHFIRGWSYFWMVRVFGGVPLMTGTEVNDATYQVERSTALEVYEQILSDLEFAATHLPESQPAYGYINRWVAKGYLAEVHLTMAGWPLKMTEHYADARDYARDIIDNSPYALLNEYASIFQMDNEANSEIIWALSLCPIEICGGGYTGSWMAQATKPAELNGWQDMFVELSFFERFPEGARKDFSILSRLKVTSEDTSDPSYVGADGNVYHYSYIDYTELSSGHPFLKKFWSGFYDSALVAGDPQQPTAPQSAMDLPMLRLAKVHLIYAESQARADGTPSAESYELLNQIRRRGKGYDLLDAGSDVDITEGSLSTEEFAGEVVDEKGWEFLGEMNRWFDLIRTERVEEMNALRSAEEPLKIQNDITKKFYLAPIPATEIAINPRLEQNPDYTN